MVGKYFIVALVLTLVGCAQVGQISGGPEDRVAPKPNMDEMIPGQASTNYEGNTIIVSFNEYFTLDKPSQTIRMVPPHATVNAEVKKKTLTLSWEETLEPNTTYAIYLNGTVRDVNERNDTTLQFVFSTGNQIDSLSYTLPVVDAFTQKALSDVTVALYDTQTDKLLSLANAENGVAQLNYLKTGTYRITAFEDENGDLEIQEDERLGFPEGGIVTVDSIFFDSIPIRIYQPKPLETKISVQSFAAPGAFILEANTRFEEVDFNSIRINGNTTAFFDFDVEKNTYTVFASNTFDEGSAQLELTYADQLMNDTVITDTLTYRFRNNEQEKPIKLKTTRKGQLKPNDVPFYEINGLIQSVDSSKITATYLDDSTSVPIQSISTGWEQMETNSFYMEVDAEPHRPFKVKVEDSAITTAQGKSRTFETTEEYAEESDFGVVNVNFPQYSESVVVELLSKEKVVDVILAEKGSVMVTFEDITPDTYTFRIIREVIENGYWDGGDLNSLRQPERVDVYSKPTKVRPNWTIDITLTPNP